MLIPNTVSGPDTSLVNTSGQLYKGDTRQILEIFVAQTAVPMGCAVGYYASEAAANGTYPIRVSLTTKNTASSAATRTVVGIYTGRVAGTSKGTRNTTFLYSLTTTPVPGFHAAAEDVIYVVVKGPAYAYVDGTTDVAWGDRLDVATESTLADDGQLAICTVTAATTKPTPSGILGFQPRFVALQLHALLGTVHNGANLTSEGANAVLVLVNC